MGISKVELGTLGPIYEDLGTSLGLYCVLPGYPSFICLNESLLAGYEAVYQFIVKVLLDYHNSIPADSKLLATGHVCYLEELIPPEAIPQPGLERELPPIVIGRAMRRWFYSTKEDSRVIGKAV
jgi:hypothetical protein